jgi:NAD(P)-dependent dehydrogenase (short-subunit alcohol dehydrogenase family)
MAMQGKVVVMTGATSGIGAVAAENLAALGATILFTARDRTRAEATLKRLAAKGRAPHRFFEGDLSRIAEMKRVGAEIAAATPRIDVLVNNAGAMFASRRLTADGLEMTFALNHVSYFVLTLALLERLRASAPSRIVSTASAAHQGAQLDFADLQTEKSYSAMRAYGRSKLCNILFTRELARRLQGTGVTANCLHPGFVATRFGSEVGGAIGLLFPVAKLFGRRPEKGAETIVHLAASPDVVAESGSYFFDCRKTRPSTAAQDDEAAFQLWTASEKLAGLAA